MPRQAIDIERIALRSLDEARANVSETVVLSKEDMLVPHETMWRPKDAPIIAATEDLILLLPHYHDDAISDHNVKNLNQDYFTKYLRMNNVRVANLADCLREKLRPG